MASEGDRIMEFLLSGKVADPERLDRVQTRPLPMAAPPHSMPGYCAAIELPEQHRGLSAAVVVEMAWAEREDSASFLHRVPFEVGSRILFASGYGGVAQIDGYLIVPVGFVVAWTPAPEEASA